MISYYRRHRLGRDRHGEEVFYTLVSRDRKHRIPRGTHKGALGLVRSKREQGKVWARDLTGSSRKEWTSRAGRLEIG